MFVIFKWIIIKWKLNDFNFLPHLSDFALFIKTSFVFYFANIKSEPGKHECGFKRKITIELF